MAGDSLFRMTVQDVFVITGKGTVVTGRIESGTLRVGDEVTIQRPGSTKSAAVAGIEMFRKVASEAQAGDNVGVLLRDVAKQDVKRGDILLGSATDFTWAP